MQIIQQLSAMEVLHIVHCNLQSMVSHAILVEIVRSNFLTTLSSFYLKINSQKQ